MTELLRKHPEVQGFFIYTPMVKSDTLSSVPPGAVSGAALCYWDGELEVSSRFTKVLGLKRQAWDVYLVYNRHAEWRDSDPPDPSFWMHQLSSGAPGKLRLDIEKFEDGLKSLK